MVITTLARFLTSAYIFEKYRLNPEHRLLTVGTFRKMPALLTYLPNGRTILRGTTDAAWTGGHRTGAAQA